MTVASSATEAIFEPAMDRKTCPPCWRATVQNASNTDAMPFSRNEDTSFANYWLTIVQQAEVDTPRFHYSTDVVLDVLHHDNETQL